MDSIDPYLYFGWNPVPRIERLSVDAGGRLPRGLRAVFAADFHIRDGTADAYVSSLCGMLRDLKPDVLLLGGDYGESKSAARRLFGALSALAPRCGAFAVVGNNDRECFSDLDEFRAIARMNVLVNEVARVPVGAGILEIAGVDEMKHGQPDARGLFADGDYRILLSHYPVVPDFGGGARADLILSGHTHGGQGNLFGLTTYSLGFERDMAAHLKGMREYGGVRLFVSTGIGMSKFPIRLGCAPRVHLVEFS